LIGKDEASRDHQLRAAMGDIDNGALALDRATNRDLRGNTYSLSRMPAPLGSRRSASIYPKSGRDDNRDI
jgi:hypothetical protein